MGDGVRLTNLVAANIRAVRIRLGLTQAQLAARAGVSIRYVQRLEQAPAKNLSLRTIEGIAKALGVSPTELTCNHSQEHTVLSKREGEAIDVAIRFLQSLRA